MLLFLRRPKRTRLQWMRDMPALTSQSKQSDESAKQSKKENKKAAKENQSNGNPVAEARNSVRRKDTQLTKQLTKQASSSSSAHQAHSSLERQTTIDSPPGKQPLQQLNVTALGSTLGNTLGATLPLGSNLMQQATFPPPMHNHFHTLATHHHFHHHHTPSLLTMQTTAAPHFHHPTCTLTPQPEQLHHLNAGQPPPLHYSSDAHLMRSLDSNLSGNLMNPNFDPLNHLLNAGDLNAAEHLSALPAHSCLPSGLLNEVDHQNENLNHLNLHHNLDNHLDFGLHRNESNELAADHCGTLPRPIQSRPCANELGNLNGGAAQNAAANQAANQINQRQASCESSASGAFYLSQAAFKATEAIEFIAEHLRNEDEYIQVRAYYDHDGNHFEMRTERTAPNLDRFVRVPLCGVALRFSQLNSFLSFPCLFFARSLPYLSIALPFLTISSSGAPYNGQRVSFRFLFALCSRVLLSGFSFQNTHPY